MTTARLVRAGSLPVAIHPTTAEMAEAAAQHTAEVLRQAVDQRGSARVIMATGNSQLAFVAALPGQDIPWSKITVFHMDEYIGVGDGHSASFRKWIRERVAEPFGPAAVEYIDGTAEDIEAECARYEALLRAAPIDLTCMGIGENGHLAFNEPGEADFADPRWVRVIRLTQRSIDQQVGEGHFPDRASVPVTAISLTIPALLAAGSVQVVTPEARKAQAVRSTLTLEPTTDWPSTILRRTPHARLFLDAESAAESAEVIRELAAAGDGA
ncbi:glucosamine-6-phosphate deaminase [Actinacidiphila alni]|uniref:Glucosamine-6-phosphate deaminase n=1 Tax=Actinacidiphila alni TaxID=380248 RepID=A0A1I2HPL2_9ACTN|nr:6-phosphogluconolactonase [Actinacidiphila alni]SFF30767.1 glucosamine-6-phosphate deaminase [Actinacidiphila alni]